MIGQTISHYKILEKLGEGGMGVVYKAQDLTLGRIVAIKVLPSSLIADENAKTRFLQEAKAASSLNHPNIMTVHEMDEVGGQSFIVTEYLEGETLKKRIKKSKLEIQDVFQIAIQIAEGLSAAHRNGIVHRDIKSENIMVTKSGTVKIMDFGLAKLKGMSPLTKTGRTVGTLAYMSPEQLLGKEVDHRSDIFSFGVVLYEILAGELPFKGEYEAAVMYTIIHEQPKLIAEKRKDVPENLTALVQKALEKNPEDRYQDVKTMIADLQPIMKSLESGEALPLIARVVKKRIRISSKRVRSAVGVFLLLGIMLWWMLVQQGEKKPLEAAVTPRKSIAILYFENHTGDKTLDRLRFGLADMLITDLSQSKSIRVLPTARLYQTLQDLKATEVEQFSSETLKKIGDFAQVEHLLTGSFIKVGKTVRIDFQVQRSSSGEMIGADKVEGEEEQAISSMVDQMTAKVKNFLGVATETPGEAESKSISEITSSSSDANILYLEGVNHFYKANYLKAITYLKKAVQEDSMFALALARLAEAYSNLGYDLKAEEYANRSLRHADRVTLNERYLIEANYAKINYDYDQAIEIYKRLAVTYPDDPHAYFDLGTAFEKKELIDSAIVSYQKVVGIEKNNAAAYAYLGILFAKKGDPKLASESINKALNIYSLVGSQEGRGLALSTLGDVLLRRGEYAEARKAYEEMLEIQRELEDKSAIASAIRSIGTTYHHQADYARARSYYEQALPVFKEIGDKRSTAAVLNNIGSIYLSQVEYARALEFHNSALKIAREIHNKKLLAEIGYNIGVDYQRMGQRDKATPYVEEAHEYFKQIGDKSDMGTSALAIGDERRDQGKIDEALRLFLESLTVGRQIADRKLISRGCERVGSIHVLQAKFEQAIHFYQEGLGISQISGDKSGMAYALSALGFIFFSVGKIDTAALIYQKALLLAQELASKELIAKVQSNIGAMWQLLGQKDSSLVWYGRAMKILRDVKSAREEIDTKSRHATLYVDMNKIKEGIALGREAVQEATQKKDEELSATVSSRLAYCYLAAQRYQQAIAEAQKAVSISRRLGMRENLWRSHAVLARAFHAQKKDAEAVENLWEVIKTLDEIERDLSEDFQTSFRKRTDIEQIAADMASIRKDVELEQEANKIKQKYEK